MAVAAVTCLPDVAEQTSLTLTRLDHKLSLRLRFLAISLSCYPVSSETENRALQNLWFSAMSVGCEHL